ncbi:MAG: prolyl oligopeptidase family serine peptidase [Alphaproteobacteria bacterium]
MLNAFDSDRRATAYPADSDEPHGRYAGVLARDDQQMPVAVTFDAKPNGLVAWLDAAALGVVGVPFDAVAYEPPRLVLTMAAGCGGEIVWTGDFADDAIRGTWRGGGIAARFELARCPAEPAWFTTQDVAFQNAGNRLAGSLIRPLGIGPHPAAVHLPGVGPAARHRSRFLAQVLARHGVASLVYDRRGTGMSDGDGVTADFGDLAADAVAGHRLLRETDGIDPARIGIVAAGEGGWVAPLAAGMTDVAYLVLCSAPAISPAEQERREVEMRLTGAVGEAERARALALVRAKQAAVRGEYDWTKLRRRLHAAAGAPWYWDAGLPDPAAFDPLAPAVARYRRDLDVDPVAALAALDIPILALYGEADRRLPALRCAGLLTGLRRHGRDVTVHVFPDAGHGLVQAPSHPGAFRWPRLATGCLEAVAAWLDMRVLSPTRRSPPGRAGRSDHAGRPVTADDRAVL